MFLLLKTTCSSSNAIGTGSNTVTLTVTFAATVTVQQATALQTALNNYVTNTGYTATVTGGGTATLTIVITGPSASGVGASIQGNYNVNADIWNVRIAIVFKGSFSSKYILQAILLQYGGGSVAPLPAARSTTVAGGTAAGLLASAALLMLSVFLFF